MNKLIHENFDLQRLEEPYAGNDDYLADWVRFLDIKIYFYLHHILKINASGEHKLDKYKGLVIGKEEILRLLAALEQGNDGAKATESAGAREYYEALPLLEAYLKHRKVISIKQGVFLPFAYLIHIFNLDPFEQHCIILGLLSCLDRKYEKVFAYLQDDVTMKYPTSDLALKLFAPGEKGLQVMQMLHPLEEKLFKYFFTGQNQHQNLLSRPLIPDKRMLDFILDYRTEAVTVERFLTLFFPGDELPELIVQGEVQQSLEKILGLDERSKLIFCHGPRGSGKKLQIKTLAQKVGKPVVFAGSSNLFKDDGRLDTVNFLKTVREALMHDAFLCLTDFQDLLPAEGRLEETVQELLWEIDSRIETVFVTSRERWQLSKKDSSYRWIDLEIGLPDRMERSVVWKSMVGSDVPGDGIAPHELANKFHFTPGQIASALVEARQTAKWQGEERLTREILIKACYRQISHSLNKKASLVLGSYVETDLVLPPEQKIQLRNACNHVQYRHIVFEQWGFEEKLSYGKGISMLFGGPPGTGKTMAAQVVAGELGLEMYKIDLSQVVSKYIGETEKNLKEVFDEAEKSNAILFFDECDALMGRRTEVKDSHDRYANIETSFLLQKVEEYEGVSILATNFMTNIDTAFLRRINYVLHFPFPDAHSREQIWRGIFPEQAPLAADIDFVYLAKQFEMAGGNIKNIAVNASFLAAASATEISMRHILLALKSELTKQGKSLVSGDFGEYAFYLQ